MQPALPNGLHMPPGSGGGSHMLPGSGSAAGGGSSAGLYHGLHPGGTAEPQRRVPGGGSAAAMPPTLLAALQPQQRPGNWAYGVSGSAAHHAQTSTAPGGMLPPQLTEKHLGS